MKPVTAPHSVFFVTSACSIALCISVMLSGCDSAPKAEKAPPEKTAVEKQPTRMSFDEMFAVSGTTVTPKKVFRVGPTTMTPEVPFESNVMMIENAPFSQYVGRDAEVRKSGEVYEIVRFY